MIGRLVRVRMRRQQALNRDGLQLSVVLDESVLKRRIGDDAVITTSFSGSPGKPNGPT